MAEEISDDSSKSEHFSNNLSLLYDKACKLASKQKYDEAILYYDQILAIDKNHLDSLYCKGLTLCYMGKYEKALSCLDEALKINPRSISSLRTKANAL